MNIIKKIIKFIKDVAEDSRIPSQDKKIILFCLALVISPIDLIPDWIPIFGMLDDFVIIALVLDYFFNVLDVEILLSHYPWGMKSFSQLKRTARMIAFFTPEILKKKLWSYQPDPYR